MRFTLCVALMLALGLAPSRAETAAGGDFDYYVLALTWLPQFCKEKPSNASCKTPQGFSVHGLWPQYARGWPQYCAARSTYVPEEVIKANRDLYLNRNFLIYEWKKHGSCSGLEPEAYFNQVRQAREKLVLPPTTENLVQDLVAANKGLGASMVQALCKDGQVSELRVCLTKELAFRRCTTRPRDLCATEGKWR